jgi:hypothetical protein
MSVPPAVSRKRGHATQNGSLTGEINPTVVSQPLESRAL